MVRNDSQNIHCLDLRALDEAAAYYEFDTVFLQPEDVRDMVTNPLGVQLTINMIDMFLRYVVAMHRRRVLYISVMYSVHLDYGAQDVDTDGMDEYFFGSRQSFDVVVLPIRVDYHYVGCLLKIVILNRLRCSVSTMSLRVSSTTTTRV